MPSRLARLRTSGFEWLHARCSSAPTTLSAASILILTPAGVKGGPIRRIPLVPMQLWTSQDYSSHLNQHTLRWLATPEGCAEAKIKQLDSSGRVSQKTGQKTVA